MGDCANVSRGGGGDAPRNLARGALHGEMCNLNVNGREYFRCEMLLAHLCFFIFLSC